MRKAVVVCPWSLDRWCSHPAPEPSSRASSAATSRAPSPRTASASAACRAPTRCRSLRRRRDGRDLHAHLRGPDDGAASPSTPHRGRSRPPSRRCRTSATGDVDGRRTPRRRAPVHDHLHPARWRGPTSPRSPRTPPGLTGGTATVHVTTTTRACAPSTTNETFDGVPLDINVAFPPDPGGADGPYPLIVWGHGYGGAKIGFGASGSTSGLRRFTSRGYAVMSMTTRGFRESCGSANSKADGGRRLRHRLRSPDGHPLRGPRLPGPRRRARRGRPRRPARRSVRSAAPTAAACRWPSAPSRTAR